MLLSQPRLPASVHTAVHPFSPPLFTTCLRALLPLFSFPNPKKTNTAGANSGKHGKYGKTASQFASADDTNSRNVQQDLYLSNTIATVAVTTSTAVPVTHSVATEAPTADATSTAASADHDGFISRAASQPAVLAQSCKDGVRNGNETYIDCGGGGCLDCKDVLFYSKRFDGYCEDGMNYEVSMYKGCGHVGGTVFTDDNPGVDDESNVANCALACQERNVTVAAKGGLPPIGFSVIPTTGRCWCAWADADTCKVKSYTKVRHEGCDNYVAGTGYERYDFAVHNNGSAPHPPELRDLPESIDGHNPDEFSEESNALCSTGFKQGYPSAVTEYTFSSSLTAAECAYAAAKMDASAWCMDNEHLLTDLDNSAGTCYYYLDQFNTNTTAAIALDYDASEDEYYVYCDLQPTWEDRASGSGSSESGNDDDGNESSGSVSAQEMEEREFQHHSPEFFSEEGNALCNGSFYHGYPKGVDEYRVAGLTARECARLAVDVGASAFVMDNQYFVEGQQNANGRCYYYLEPFDPQDDDTFAVDYDAYYDDYYVTCDLQPTWPFTTKTSTTTTATTATTTTTTTTTATTTSTPSTTPTKDELPEFRLPECTCKQKWSHGAKTYTGCATTADNPFRNHSSWCYTEGPCKGSSGSSAYAGWHWSTCEINSHIFANDDEEYCSGLRRKKCMGNYATQGTCRWVGGKGKGCYAAAQDLPCKAFGASKWTCRVGGGGSKDKQENRCTWWNKKCIDNLICDSESSKCCDKGRKACRNHNAECSWVRKSQCIPRPDTDGKLMNQLALTTEAPQTTTEVPQTTTSLAQATAIQYIETEGQASFRELSEIMRAAEAGPNAFAVPADKSTEVRVAGNNDEHRPLSRAKEGKRYQGRKDTLFDKRREQVQQARPLLSTKSLITSAALVCTFMFIVYGVAVYSLGPTLRVRDAGARVEKSPLLVDATTLRVYCDPNKSVFKREGKEMLRGVPTIQVEKGSSYMAPAAEEAYEYALPSDGPAMLQAGSEV